MSGGHLARGLRALAGDRVAAADSPLRRAPAGLKLLATLAFVSALALVPVTRPSWLAGALALVVAGSLLARVLPSSLLARLAIVQPFVLGVAVLALFQGRGLAVFAALALKSTACVAAVQLLAHTTPMQDTLAALRRARVPSALVLALALLPRYLFVLVEESQRMQRARAARTWKTGARWGVWRTLASVIAVSFVRSVTRAERIAVAMRARGWS